MTNRQRRSFGNSQAFLELGEDFICQAPSGHRIVCVFGGHNSQILNYIGICYQQLIEEAGTIIVMALALIKDLEVPYRNKRPANMYINNMFGLISTL